MPTVHRDLQDVLAHLAKESEGIKCLQAQLKGRRHASLQQLPSSQTKPVAQLSWTWQPMRPALCWCVESRRLLLSRHNAPLGDDPRKARHPTLLPHSCGWNTHACISSLPADRHTLTIASSRSLATSEGVLGSPCHATVSKQWRSVRRVHFHNRAGKWFLIAACVRHSREISNMCRFWLQVQQVFPHRARPGASHCSALLIRRRPRDRAPNRAPRAAAAASLRHRCDTALSDDRRSLYEE